MSCLVCLEDYKGKSIVKITCQYCPSNACRGCLQRHMLQSTEDPHCIECKRGWSSEFMAANFPLSFRNDTLRKHRRGILFEREKSLLPAMQIFVEYRKNIAKHEQEVKDLRAVYGFPDNREPTPEEETKIGWRFKKMSQRVGRIKAERETLAKRMMVIDQQSIQDLAAASSTDKVQEILTDKMRDLLPLQTRRKELKKELAELDEPYRELTAEHRRLFDAINTAIRSEWQNRQLYLNGDGAPTQRREFIMKCADETCRGFLSTAYKCGTCEKWTCAHCLVVVGTEKDAAHTCDPNTVETAKAIKTETRPCPKCGTRIFKIDGCDQMWCIMDGCQTAFSWDTGHVVTGKVHNPHYYEWLRRNGGGTAPREVGDIPCGGLPAIHELFRVMRSDEIPATVKGVIFETHRNLRELIDMRLYDFPARPPNLVNKDIDVHYLMNNLSEDEWKRQLELSEAKFQRKKEIGQILQTLATAGADLMNHVVNRAGADPAVYAVWLSETAIAEFDQLRAFGNDSLKGLAKRDRIAVPQFEANWAWKPLRALYKPTKVAEATA